MKKIISIPIVALMLSFTAKNSVKIVGGGILASEITKEVKAQYLTLADTVLFKPARYVPTMQTFGFNIGFDGSGVFYPAARPDYRFDIDVLPNLASVALSGSYYDLSYAPDLNNIPVYWHKFESDTLYANARNTITIMNGTTAITQNMQASRTFSLPAIMNYSAGYGEIMTGTAPNMVIKADTGSANGLMSKDRAAASIASINSSIASKAPLTRSLTINGVSQDLSANRAWTIPTGTTSYSGSTGINVTNTVITNTAPDQVVNLTGIKGVSISGTYPNFTISLAEPTINNNPVRGVTTSTSSTGFTISPNFSTVYYYVTCSVSNPLLAGSSTATVYLEYSLNGGSTWTAVLQPAGNLSSVALAVAIQITNGQTTMIGGGIPGGANVRIRYATTGTGTVTYIGGQEITR